MAALGFSSLLLLAVIIYGCHSHPQCLDFQPPFVPNAKRMWCRRYSKLGCCTAKQDAILKSRYDSALKIVRVKKQHKCKRYLFKVVCLECHSWSAHIFDAETNPYYSANSALPCLGYKFCQRLVKYCGPAIEQLYGQAMSNRNITLRDFCREAEVTLNRDLCYPKIRKTLKRMKMQKQRNVVYWNATKKGCLCVREVSFSFLKLNTIQNCYSWQGFNVLCIVINYRQVSLMIDEYVENLFCSRGILAMHIHETDDLSNENFSATYMKKKTCQMKTCQPCTLKSRLVEGKHVSH